MFSLRKSNAVAGRPAPKRPRWQRALRAVALAAVVGGMLCASIPYWAPRCLLRQWVQASLGRQLGLPVSLGYLDLSWEEGVTLTDLRIGNGPDFPDGDMVTLARLRCQFSPWRLLLGLPPKWVQVDGAHLGVVINGDGKVNLAGLKGMLEGDAPDRLAVRRAALTVDLPLKDAPLSRPWLAWVGDWDFAPVGQAHRFRLEVADLQYVAGKAQSLGRVTMSAMLAQDGGNAPVTLRAVSGGPEKSVKCSFRFSAVDLGQLNLPLLLPLRLAHMGGVAGGRLDVQLTAAGVVSRFEYDMRIKNLDAQPVGGPALPVIAEAQTYLSASITPFLDRTEGETEITIHRFSARLPGVELAGDGKMYAAALGGSWEGLRKLNLTGTINPATLAALSGNPLPADLTVDGLVGLRLTATGEETDTDLAVVVDATPASIRRAGSVLKPPGRKLVAELSGELDRVHRRFKADRFNITLGGNRFFGGGAIENIRRVLDAALHADQPPPLRTQLRNLASLDWHGEWEITELDSMRDLLGVAWLEQAAAGSPDRDLGDALRQVKFDGVITGEWTISHAPEILLSAHMSAGAGTRLSAGRWFAKPPDALVRLETSMRIDADWLRVRDFRLWLGTGDAGVGVEDGALTLSNSQDGKAALEAQGTLVARGLGQFKQCIPAAGGWEGQAGGNAAAQFHLWLLPTFQRLHVEANGTQMSLALADVFDKPAGQPADVVADLQSDQRLPPAQRGRASVKVNLGSSTLEAGVTLPDPSAGDAPIAWKVRATASDAAWILQRCPALGRMLQPYQVSGSLAVDLKGEFGGGKLWGDLLVDGDDLQFRLPGLAGSKNRGSALRLGLAGTLDAHTADIYRLALDMGKSSLWAQGQLQLATEAGRPAGNPHWPPPGIAGGKLDIRGTVALDSFARAAMPELARQLRQAGIDGGARYEGTVHIGPGGLDMQARVDAAGVTLANDSVRKPAGSPCTAAVSATIPADLSVVTVRDLLVQLPAGEVRAGATLPLLRPGKPVAHVAVNCPDLARLVEMAPAWAKYSPAGGVMIDAVLTHEDDGWLANHVWLVARKATGKLNGLAWRLDGMAGVQNARWGGELDAGRVTTEGFEFALGRTHGWLTADVAKAHDVTTGRVEVICTDVDVPELTNPPGLPTAPTTPLSGEEVKELSARGDRALVGVKDFCAGLDKLDLHVEVGRLRYFDDTVKAFYEARGLVLDAAATPCDISLGARFGFNGGTMRMTQAVDLTLPTPLVRARQQARDVFSSPGVLAQLAQEFPGNTFYATFSRDEDETYSLHDMLMNTLDGRFKQPFTGTAKTVTNDGVVRGRGAPEFVARIFPGLNLTTYRYRRMTAFADFLGGGASENDMIFDGYDYDLYISGATDADRRAKYEIGVILLGSAGSPEFNHNYHGNRIPVLDFSARIVDGAFQDEDIRYPLPSETAFKVFLQRNTFYQLYLAAKKNQADQAKSPLVPTTLPAKK